MLVLGLLLAAASAAFVGLLIAYNTGGGPDYTVTMFNQDVVTLNTLAVFCAGIALALIFALGLALMRRSMRRTGRAHRRVGHGYGTPPMRTREGPTTSSTMTRESVAPPPEAGPPPAGAGPPPREWAADQEAAPAASESEAQTQPGQGAEQPRARHWWSRG